MNPDIVSQMGAMVVRAILAAMALVASLAGVVMFVETLRQWQNRETRLKDGDHDPGMTPAIQKPLMFSASARGPKTHQYAAASRLDSNQSGLRIRPLR
jgi:hypothetical protein